MRWIEADIVNRRRFIFDVLKFIRLPLVPSRLLESYLQEECRDISLRVALISVKKDVSSRKGSLVTLNAQPRLYARKNVYIIGGSQREVGTTWSKAECTFHTVEVFDSFKGDYPYSRASLGYVCPALLKPPPCSCPKASGIRQRP